MNTLDRSILNSQFAAQPLDAALDTAVDAAKGDAFGAALDRAQSAAAPAATAPVDPVVRPAGVDGPAPVAQADPADAADRARRTLGLSPAEGPDKASSGDLILDGLQKLRGNFDSSSQRIAAVMNGAPVDAEQMLSVQVELVRFSLLTDVTSKLTGKSTQAFDTLMKGQ